MIKLDEYSNAQSWELEITCKNKQYLDEVVKSILKYGFINFEIENTEITKNYDDVFEGRYLVLIWSHWFNNLYDLSKDLKEIEDKQEIT